MPNDPAAATARFARIALISLCTSLAALALAAAIAPTTWFEQLAGRAGHGDDAAPDRILRLRGTAGLFAAIHALAAWIFARTARDPLTRFLAALAADLRSARPAHAARQAWQLATRHGRMHCAALAIVLAAAAGIRLLYLNVPMDYDEAYSFLNYARRPLYQALADYNSTNNHLLNTAGMHATYRVFGPLEWALRLHVLAAGLALVVTGYVVARQLLDADAALVTAALLAVNYVMVNYSVNARGYIWVAWMSLLLLYACWRIADETERLASDWVAAAAAAVLGLFAMPTMLYTIAGCTAWLIIRAMRSAADRRNRLIAIAAWLGTVAWATAWLYAPAYIFRGTAAWQHPFVSPIAPLEWLARVPWSALLALKSWAESPLPWFVPAICFAVGCVSFIRRRAQTPADPDRPDRPAAPPRQAAQLLLCIAIATAAILAVQRVAPPPRVLSFLMPLFAIVAAAGVTTLVHAAFTVAMRNASGHSPAQHTNLPNSTAATAAPAALHAAIAVVIVIWGAFDCASKPLPGGLHPAFLIEHVTDRPHHAIVETDYQTRNQLWRLDVEQSVAIVAEHARPNGRVLVGVPIDLPFHFYAQRVGLAVPIGGTPLPNEQWLLVARRGEQPSSTLRENLSLRIDRPDVLTAAWRPVATLDHLTIWHAQRPPAAATD